MRNEYEPTRLAGTEAEHFDGEGAVMPLTHTPQSFAAALADERAKRNALEDYIRSGLKQGVDYDRVGPSKKNTLLKPGAEKVAALLRLRATFHKDGETVEMLADAERGTLAYVCQLVTPAGEVAAEGRGACSPDERPNVNVRIKIAMKRAQVDAVLRVAALSDHFTQDLDDLPSDYQSAPRPSAPRPSRGPKPGEEWVPNGCRIMFAKFDSVCEICGHDISQGQEQMFSTNTRKAFHVPCAKADILGDGEPEPTAPSDAEEVPF